MKICNIFSHKIFKIIFNILRTLIYGTLILYIMFILFQRFTNNSSFMGYRVFSVATGSMIPVYNVNDVIIVKDVDVSSLKVGDDVAYRGSRGGFENLIITHRIIKIDAEDGVPKRIFTQGVNNKSPDPSISPSQILGKVQGKLLFINTINHMVKSTVGFFFFVFCPLVIVISLEIAQSAIEIKLEKNEIRKIK